MRSEAATATYFSDWCSTDFIRKFKNIFKGADFSEEFK